MREDKREELSEKELEFMLSRITRRCNFCGITFSNVDDLNSHQRRNHDPDGMLFLELYPS